jgi:hypothetical protein
VSASDREARDTVRARRLVWTSSLACAGPAAWFLDLNLRYFLVESGVAARHPTAVPCAGIALVFIAAGASVANWRRHRRLAARDPGASFLALLGCVLSGYAAIVMIAMLVPHLFLDGSARG